MTTKESVGSRIRKFREEKGMTATELAEKARVSKSYLSELESENGDAKKKPSGEMLYDIAKALGVAMSDLLGRPIITDANRSPRPASLTKFGRLYKRPEADLQMLEQIQFRGDPPKTPERWLVIYQAIKGSESMDG